MIRGFPKQINFIHLMNLRGFPMVSVAGFPSCSSYSNTNVLPMTAYCLKTDLLKIHFLIQKTPKFCSAVQTFC